MLFISNIDNYELPEDLESKFKTIYKKFLTRFELPEYSLELNFVSSEEIRELNREYRGKDYATDVLSFPCNPSPYENILGSIFFCYSEIKKNNIDLDYEFRLLFSHSLLHLIGYEHGEEMFSLQENLLIVDNIDK